MMTRTDPHLDAIRVEVEALLIDHGLTERGWRFEWDRAVRRAGCCRHKQRLITLSRPIFAAAPDADWRNTALHEIAHALVGPKKGHGPEWQRVALEIGCDARRLHNHPTPPGKIVGFCACGVAHNRVRMPTANYRCRNCRQLITWRRP